MNFNAQHWSPSRILGSHLLEKKSHEECSALQSAAARGDVSCCVCTCVCVCVGGIGKKAGGRVHGMYEAMLCWRGIII